MPLTEFGARLFILAEELLPLDFEIQSGQDEGSIDSGVPGILVKNIKDGSVLRKYNVRVGDYILKVCLFIQNEQLTETYEPAKQSLWTPIQFTSILFNPSAVRPNGVSCNISNTRKSVSSDYQTLRSG